ncbi:MAG: hypothetical protein JHC98_06490 [Thermoleophilaceae bacterium]|nr:hypothetical protein [Thermoleophilaceae bacterium]
MTRTYTTKMAMMLTLLMLAVSVFAAQASAAPKDRNDNGIPDAWEKAHDLSTKKDQGNRDADGDGARNRCEYQAKTDPGVADSDADTIVDGDEDTDGDGATNRAESNLHSNCGRANSHLQIRRATVTSLTDGVLVLTVRGGGTVTAPVSSTLRCSVKKATDDASTSSEGKGSPKSSCAVADLVTGAKVHKARTKGGKFVAVTLVK